MLHFFLKATPEQVKSVAYECLNATMTMDTAQIQSLAEEINTAIGKLNSLITLNIITCGYEKSQAKKLFFQ